MKKNLVILLRFFWGFFYDKKYLQGYFFETKKIGWYWCAIGLSSRLWGANRNIPWPVNPNSIVSNPNIDFNINDINIFQTPGCYWQNHKAKIVIGARCWIAPNVGLITTNHDINNPSKHTDGEEIIIGNDCWIGMNAVVLPGVTLGDHTVVGAGAVVTKSFPQGYCVIAGVPAKVVKVLDEYSSE